ncbi:MAG: hypothetical protein ACRC0G_07670 [Fusobacteriaceae bacterium]
MLLGLKNLNESNFILNGNTARPTSLFNESFDFTAMSYEMIHESQKSWNKLNGMVAKANCALIHESVTNPEGLEMFTENILVSFYQKVKAFFVKMWAMIKEVFSKFVMWIDSKLKTDKEFVDKYEKEIKAKIQVIKEVTVSGYEYTIDKIDMSKAVLPEVTKEAGEKNFNDLKASKKSQEELVDVDKLDVVKALTGVTSSIDLDDIGATLFEVLRNGDSTESDQVLNSTHVTKILTNLKTASTVKSKMEKGKVQLDKSYAKLIKQLDKVAAEEVNVKDEGNKKVFDILIAGAREIAVIVNQAYTYKIAAAKEEAEFGKKVILKIKNTSSKKNESYGVSDDEGLFSGTI